MLERSTLRSFTVLALFCGNTALAGSESAAPGKVESIETSVCRLIESSARTQSLPVAFLTRLIWQESSFRPDTISPAGAQGIAHFMPKTADERGLANPFDPEEAIPKSAELLADLKQRFGNLGLAAAAYNAGAARVANWLSGAGKLPAETRDYVLTITRHPVGLDRRCRGGNDNRRRTILEAILFTNDSRRSPLRTSVRCRLRALCALERPARRQFFEGSGAGRLHPRPAQLFRYYWQDRTHGHRRSRTQPRLCSLLSSTRTCALPRGS
ncbi:MAG: lytic transglycosylase domain-containing protein [Methylocella sp.]